MPKKEGESISVIQAFRHESYVQYVTTARDIYKETVYFTSRLSARFGRSVGNMTVELAADVFKYTMMACDIYISDESTYKLRQKYLVKARAALHALWAALEIGYEVMYENPQGCFSGTEKKSVSPSKAREKLDIIAEKLGGLINDEYVLLCGVLKSDKKKRKEKRDGKKE